MNRISCSIIKDLMPSYADGILREETRKAVDEHIASCAECRAELALMCGTTPLDGGAADKDEAPEIDFLKRNRRRNRLIAALSAAAVIIAAGVLFLMNYVIGRAGVPAEMDYDLNVDGENVTISGDVYDDCVVSLVRFREDDGVVSITTNTVKSSPFYGASFKGSYKAREKIKKVIFNNKTVWYDVSDKVRELLESKKDDQSSVQSAQEALYGLLPNNPNACFSEWSAGTEFIGIDLWNPFEGAEGFIKRNYSGPGIVISTGIYEGSWVPNYPAHSMHACLFINRDRSTSGNRSRFDEDGNQRVLNMDLAASYAVEGTLVTLRARPIGRLGVVSDFERRELGGGIEGKVVRTKLTIGLSEEIFFEYDGVDYQIYVISQTGENALDRALERVYAALKTGLAGEEPKAEPTTLG